MIVKQVSVFIENKHGKLYEIADVLANEGIDISALSLADTDEYGVLRMILSDPEKSVKILKENGIIGKITDVLAVAVEDCPGGFSKALHILTDAGFEVRYMYACVAHADNKALMIFSVNNPEEADKLIEATESGKINPSEIYRL